MNNRIWTSALAIGLAACTTAGVDEDGADDTFVQQGKADGGGISDGSPEALGVLRVANESSLSTLRSDVGLSSRTAKNIVAYRAGSDHVLGTADDRSIATLAELDAIRYVGPIAFRELLAYAEAQGYVSSGSDPFSADPHGQPIATYDDVLDLLPPGASFAKLGRFKLYEQHRDCGSSGCSPWQDTNSLGFTTILTGDPSGSSFDGLSQVGELYLIATPDYPQENLSLELQGDPQAGMRLFIKCEVGPWNGDWMHAVISARGLTTCDTSVTAYDEIGGETTGASVPFGSLWGVNVAGTPIDWAGQTPDDEGFLTTSQLHLVANQHADDYGQTARLAITAAIARP
jgi:hypothetical protein